MSRIVHRFYTETHGSGPDVFMIHGWGMHSGVWREFSTDLAGRGFRVTLADLPGHGRSGMVARYDLEGLASALAELAPSGCHLVGWSLGGMIALNMAVQCPARFRTLTTVASNPRFCGDVDWPGVDPQVLLKFSDDVLTDHHRTLMRFFGLQTWGMQDAKEQLRLLRERLEECPEPDVAALTGGLEILRVCDLRREFQALRMPVQVLLGAKDRLVPAAVAVRLQDLAGESCVHVLSRSAHLPFVTEREECARIVTRFWEDNGAMMRACR